MADNKSFLERLSEKIAPPSKELNINADRVGGLAGLRAEPYSSGISAEDAYRLAQIKDAQNINAQRAYDNAAVDRYTKGKEFSDATSFDRYMLNDAYKKGDMIGIPPLERGIDAKTAEYYKQQNVDPGLAAKWMADRESFR